MFKSVTPLFAVAGQITTRDLADASGQGFAAVINNRPDNEEPGQPGAAELAEAATALGLAYHVIPVGRAGLSHDIIEATNAALAAAPGPVLAFCRSGTRSISLWALARAAAGEEPHQLIAQAQAAGYDLRSLAGQLEAMRPA